VKQFFGQFKKIICISTDWKIESLDFANDYKNVFLCK